MPNALQQARELIAAMEVPAPLANTFEGPKDFARSLGYLLALKTQALTNEGQEALGISKYKGMPHLPPGFVWPKGEYFLLQLNLDDVAALDHDNVFPDKGMLYFFFNNTKRFTVHYYDGPLDALQVTPYPSLEQFPDAKYYMKDFLKGAAAIAVVPSFIFYSNDGDMFDHRHTMALVPAALQAQLGQLLRASPIGFDPSLKIFGKAHFWQGEDEIDPDAIDEADTEFLATLPPKGSVLLLQDEFGEGTLHWWGDAQRIRRGDFSGCALTYSGT